ncbi:MAG: hypothetical protein Wins2KO_12850 [Winogradskyella sp.]
MKPTTEKVKILLVDDKPENLFSLKAILEGNDREIISASSGNEALKLAIKHEFALILTDVQMPEMDGFEMVEILRSNPKNKNIPIIFVTAISKEEKYVYKGYNEGAVDYLFKPLDANIVQAKTEVFITLHKQKQQLELQKQKLQQVNVQKNKYLGMAAHDLRNPLGVMQYFSSILLEEAKEMLTPEFYQHIEVIHSSSNFMINMVNELLDISKIESGTFTLNKQAASVISLVKEAVSVNRIFAHKKKIEITADVSNDIPNMMLDYPKLTQVLNNLIGNAIKYSAPKSKITVIASSNDDNLTIKVIDEGQGIPKSDIKKLFQPFQTTSIKATAGEKSTGLGLTIASKMVEAHNGSIKVDSELGNGSTFTVSIPIIRVEQEERQTTPFGAKEDHTDGYRELLICEDDLMIQMLMKHVLQVFDVKVHFAMNGKEGLDILKTNSKIDLVFTDLNMPVMSGNELINQIKKQDLNVDVVVLTGKITEDIVNASNNSDSLRYLEKPINRSDLQHILESKGKNKKMLAS